MDAIHDAPVSYIVRMHHKQEDDGFEDLLHSVPEHEAHKQQLGAGKDQYLCRSDAEHQKPYYDDDDAHDHARHPMQLFYRGLGIVQGMS
jgi:hypothetical protein